MCWCVVGAAVLAVIAVAAIGWWSFRNRNVERLRRDFDAVNQRLVEVEGKLSAAQRLLKKPYEAEGLTPDEIAERFRRADV